MIIGTMMWVSVIILTLYYAVPSAEMKRAHDPSGRTLYYLLWSGFFVCLLGGHYHFMQQHGLGMQAIGADILGMAIFAIGLFVARVVSHGKRTPKTLPAHPTHTSDYERHVHAPQAGFMTHHPLR
jgi:drug/metabolite transporter (DMT)-like permease